jgi:hypothetical protein
MKWSERDHYFFIHLSEMVYLVLRMGMELPTESLSVGRPRYVRLIIVKFDIDNTVTCSSKYHQRVGIPFHHIIAVVGDVHCSMIDMRWRKALQHYFGVKGLDNMTRILLKALKSKRKACRCIRKTPCEYPIYFWPCRGKAFCTL